MWGRKHPRYIQYAVEKETGTVLSRVGGEIAFPVLDYAGMLPENNWAMYYNLERFPVAGFFLGSDYHRDYRWTRKIPTELKNRHRVFWGMKPLTEVVK